MVGDPTVNLSQIHHKLRFDMKNIVKSIEFDEEKFIKATNFEKIDGACFMNKIQWTSLKFGESSPEY